MRDRGQLPLQQTTVMVWVLYSNDNDYTYMGTGSIQIVTDADQFQYQHYVQVTNPQNNLLFLRSRLQPNNVYERQKSTVITWSDPQQEVQNNIGISFEDEATCDMYWRILCSKVGKNYLQINGREKLDMPNQKNVRILMEKIRTSYNLVAYHVINSKQFVDAFFKTLHKLNINNNQIKGVTVIRQLLSHFDPKITQVFLSDPNFYKLLEIYEFETNINFKAYYQKTTGAQEIVQLTETARKRIQLALRSKFVKECVIDHSKDTMILNMLNQIIKENQIQALIDMLNNKCIEKIVQLYQLSKNEEKIKRDETVRRLLTFMLESAWILRIHHADNTKGVYVTTFYKSGMLRVMTELLNQGFYKALQVLGCMAVLDKNTFLNQFTDDYRKNSGNSIMRIIGKQFSQSPLQQFVDQTIDFLKNLGPLLQGNKPMFEFFNKTTIYSIFASCKFPNRILPLIIVCISELKAIKPIFEYINKFKYFQIYAQKIQKKQLPKKQMLLLSKIIRLVMEQDRQERTEYVISAYQTIVKTNIFKLLLIYLRQNIHHNNILTSSIIGVITFLSKLNHNQLTKQVKEFDFGDLSQKCYYNLRKPIQLIKSKTQEKKLTENQNLGSQGQKRVHKTILDDEEQQKYLQQDEKLEKEDIRTNQQHKQNRSKGQQMEATMKKLMQIKSDIKSKQMQEQNIQNQLKGRSDRLKAQKKTDGEIQFRFQDIDEF